jgi:hypothetical protein
MRSVRGEECKTALSSGVSAVASPRLMRVTLAVIAALTLWGLLMLIVVQSMEFLSSWP